MLILHGARRLCIQKTIKPERKPCFKQIGETKQQSTSVKHFEDPKTDNRRTRNQAWLTLTSYFDSKRNFGQFYVLFVLFWYFFFPFCSIDGISWKDRKTDLQRNSHQNIVQFATAFRCWFFKQSFNTDVRPSERICDPQQACTHSTRDKECGG